MKKTHTVTSTLLNPKAHSGVPGHKDPSEKRVEEFFQTQEDMALRAKAMNQPQAARDIKDKGGEKLARDLAKAAQEIRIGTD